MAQRAMAYVECSRLQKDDIIVHPRRANRLGVVCQTSHDVSESEDEVWDQFSGELLSGQARIYWFPSGRVSVIPENARLCDRGFNPGDIVRRRNSRADGPTGTVINLRPLLTLRVLGTPLAIRDVPWNEIEVPRGWPGMTVVLRRWVGRVQDVRQSLTLQLKNGARCVLADHDGTFVTDLNDMKRVSDVFQSDSFFPGQPVVCRAAAFKHAHWLTGQRPAIGKNSSVKCIVLAVELTEVVVHWLERACGPPCPEPSQHVIGEDVKKLQLLRFFDSMDYNLGDRCSLHFGSATSSEDPNSTENGLVPPTPSCHGDIAMAAEASAATAEEGTVLFSSDTPLTEDDIPPSMEDLQGPLQGQMSFRPTYMSSRFSLAMEPDRTGGPRMLGNLDYEYAAALQAEEMEVEDVSETPDEEGHRLPTRNHARAVERMPPLLMNFLHSLLMSRHSRLMISRTNASETDSSDESDTEHPNSTGEHAPTSLVSLRQRHHHRRALEPGTSYSQLNGAYPDESSRNGTETPVDDCKQLDEEDDTSASKGAAFSFSMLSANGKVKHTLAWKEASNVLQGVCCAEVVQRLTTVGVLWQNGVIEELPSTALETVPSMDELDFWPGVFVRDARLQDRHRRGVVIKCDRAQRTCSVNWLESDLSGGTGIEQDISVYEIQEDNGSSLQIGDIVVALETFPRPNGDIMPAAGEVTAVSLESGFIEVAWCDGTKFSVPVSCLLRVDLKNPFSEGWDGFDSQGSFTEVVSVDSDMSGWETMSSDEDVEVTGGNSEDSANENLIDSPVDEATENREDPQQSVSTDGPEEAMLKDLPSSAVGKDDESPQVVEMIDAVETRGEPSAMASTADIDGERALEAFAILDCAPASHHYANKPFSPQCRKDFLTAVRKDLKLLQGSLPRGIFVRAFSDRLDLFTVMIVGPDDTPYAGMPVICDVKLPEDYPFHPPMFYYHAFCSGRLNPNLYENGKICVSLLGTWDGEGSEKWNSKKSSILQVLLSIQGLILCSEPYYNEPGYSKQKDTPEGQENSRLYNEMALYRACQSMLAVMKRPPEALQDEVKQLFISEGSRILARLGSYVSLSTPGAAQPSSEASSGIARPSFPLLPLSVGLQKSLSSLLDSLRSALAEIGEQKENA